LPDRPPARRLLRAQRARHLPLQRLPAPAGRLPPVRLPQRQADLGRLRETHPGAMTLPLDAPPYELAALREVLARRATQLPGAFAALFDPLAARVPVPWLPPEMAHVLRSFGLVAGERQLVGQLRLRRHDDRFYLLDTGRPGEYRQDVWPETDALLAE